MSHFGNLIQQKTTTKNYSSLHTMCTLGDIDVHTLKLILCCSSLEECSSVIAFEWTPSGETKLQVGYKKLCDSNRSDWKIRFYLNYPHPFEAIEVRTNYSHQPKEQRAEIKSSSSSANQWYFIAHIDLKCTNFATVTIQIDIAHNDNETDNTSPSLHNLLADPIYSDATFESCDGVALKIHKCVLAPRSDVFKAHFIDSSSSTIQSIFEGVVLKELLNFIYSGIKAVNMKSVADRLFLAAEFYKLNDLKIFCKYALYKQLTKDNVIHTLMFADAHSAPDLKNLAMDFLDSNASIVITEPAWTDLKSTEILKVLYESTRAILEHITEEEHENEN